MLSGFSVLNDLSILLGSCYTDNLIGAPYFKLSGEAKTYPTNKAAMNQIITALLIRYDVTWLCQQVYTPSHNLQ